MDDERLMARAEQTLTEIKVAHGLSEDHAAVLAALRIRLKGRDTGSLDDLLSAAEDERGSLDDLLGSGEGEPKKPTLDDLFAQGPDGA